MKKMLFSELNSSPERFIVGNTSSDCTKKYQNHHNSPQIAHFRLSFRVATNWMAIMGHSAQPAMIATMTPAALPRPNAANISGK